MSLDLYRRVLGTPAYENENVLLYCADSLELMQHFPVNSIPLTVTSPPYNIGKSYEKIKRVDEYIEWTREWTTLVHRITSANGAFWLNLGYMPIEEVAKAMPISYLVWQQIPFFLIQEIVWNYGAGVAGRLFFSPRNEKFLWYVKNPDDYIFNLDDIRDPDVKYPNQSKNGKLKCNPLGKNPSDVWRIAKVTSGSNRSSIERTSHPAQFPVELVNRAILASSKNGDIVFDPFVGSGSLLDAAVAADRKAIGVEINAQYVQIAAQRLEGSRRERAHQAAQHSLFKTTVNL